MKNLSLNDYQQFKGNASILANDSYGDKVLLLPDDRNY